MLSVTPLKIDVKLAKGAKVQKPVTISNAGGTDLEYRITGAVSADSAAVKRYAPEHYVFRNRAQGDSRKGDPVLQGSGGPDAFGYTWTDSDQPGGPAFDWTDISLSGTQLTNVSNCLDCYEQVALDVPFSFYGQAYSDLYVSSHGHVTFGMGSSQYYNYPLPSTTAPLNLVAALWDDVSPVGNGDAYYQHFPDRTVIQWNGISHYSTGGVYTFQIVLKHDGSILYYYHTLAGDVTSATVGIQDGTGTVGLGIAYNAAYLHEGMAVRIASNPPWLKISSVKGIVPPGGSVTLQATFDAAGIESGSYQQDLGVITNAPVSGSAVVDCNLTVEGMRLRNLQAGRSGSALAKGAKYSIRNLKAGGAGSKLLKGATYSLVLE
jgi:large repetitive protein